VREITLIPDNSGRLLVRFVVTDPDFKLPLNSVAKISSLDLLGSKSINLLLGLKSGEYHEPGDTLAVSVEASLSEEVNNQILPLKKKAEDLLSSMDTTIRVIQAILNKEARENLSASFESIKNALFTFERVALRLDTMIYSEKDKLARILTNFQSISNNLRNNNENITQILDNVAYITDSIALSNITQTINNAGVAFSNAAEIMQRIDRGEGTLGQLVQNDSLYQYLEKSARDLDKLLTDINDHPNRYVHFSVFGRRDKEQKKKEKAARRREKELQKTN
jgi:phospholipid/cholesterol/gamma-HCH transport system substrate-binding protein